NRYAIKLLQQVRDAPPLKHHRAPRHLGRMRGKDGGNADSLQKIVRLGRVQSGLAQSAQRSPQIASLRRSILIQLDGQPPAFAVVRLGQVDQLEIKTEG